MNTILILGGGLAQLGLIKTAKSMGLRVVVVGIKGDYPGYPLADKVYYEDIFDKEAVLKVAKEESINGICMVCSDFALSTMGYVNDQLGLNGLSEKCAEDSSDKYKMKQLLMDGGVPTPRYATLKNDADVSRAIKELNFPLIVKAVDLQGSRGIYICRNEKELVNNYKKSIEESWQDYCIVEEYIEGDEFGAQAFIQNGEVLFVEAHGDQIKRSDARNVPVGHYVPLYACNDSRNEEIKDIVGKAIHAMGFNNCAVNVDLIEKDGKPYIIELTGRAGANSLPEMMSGYFGFNYYEMILDNALGKSVKHYMEKVQKEETCCVMARQMFVSKTGTLRKINYKQQNDLSLFELFVKEGAQVREFTNSVDCIGRMIYKGKTVGECKKYLDEFESSIEFVIE